MDTCAFVHVRIFRSEFQFKNYASTYFHHLSNFVQSARLLRLTLGQYLEGEFWPNYFMHCCRGKQSQFHETENQPNLPAARPLDDNDDDIDT